MDGTVHRISSLPDDVLTHILTFLSTREAVQTCLLSKRWRNAWASVPVLKFHLDESWINNADNETDKELKFDQFVNGMFGHRGPSHLDTVIYSATFGHGSWEPSMGWLDHAALLMPRAISIDIVGVEKLNFPDSVFSCASLESLELSLFPYGRIIRPRSIALASLKTLNLRLIRLDDDFMQKLFLGCPILESLKLHHCELFISDISSSMLKELAILECPQFQNMQISCPGLFSLFIRTSMKCIQIISLENMASLVKAYISLYGYDQEVCYYPFDVQADVNNVPNSANSKFLSGLSNVTSLELHFDDPDWIQWFEDIITNYKTFYNLKRLDIGAWSVDNDFRLVACFIEHSPVLEQLTLRLDRKQWEKHICRTFYNFKSLIIGAWNIVNGFSLVAWFLEHCPILQQLILLSYRIQDDTQKEPRQVVSFQLEYLETVNISCEKKDELACKLATELGQHIKTNRPLEILISWNIDIYQLIDVIVNNMFPSSIRSS
ncbi:hypothetical protein LUZ61_013353 [Rhynchospora tenuis]|uniref:F-box domain-containing protein n=1 Tax=Rhynchospora tenuis TaxID=198213 RepID=A0AAD5Z2M9_9POAL|nr:hypothetical protein LUZ61_013353 [Rhynchospora tenuis]